MEVSPLFENLLPALIGAMVALFLKPLSEFIYGRISGTRAFYAHTADRIRDFRESVAVLESILLRYEDKKYPIDMHISKLAVPDSLTTNKAIDLFALSVSRHADALQISNLLVNVSRDADSILQSKRLGQNGHEAFMRQCWELSDKLRNLAMEFEKRFERAAKVHRKKGTSQRPKEILWEDGSSTMGFAFSATRSQDVAVIAARWKKASEKPGKDTGAT